MESATQVDNVVFTGGSPNELNSGFDGFRSRVTEIDPVELIRHFFTQLTGQRSSQDWSIKPDPTGKIGLDNFEK